ncbi:MAG: YraN family protein [Lachnospiraceae bacterium]|nr:YraN family protein [Lachnospiraceae bacterium]
MNHNRRTGVLGEAIAAHFLEENGLQILERNYRSCFGEIDIIARDRWDLIVKHASEVPMALQLVVVEVKTRRSVSSGSGAEAVSYSKQRKICYAFNEYRMKHRIGDYVPVRFDVIEVDGAGHCHWIRNAFEFVE